MGIEISQAAEKAMLRLPKRLRVKVDREILALNPEEPRDPYNEDVIPYRGIYGIPVNGLQVVYKVETDGNFRIISIEPR